MARTFSTTGGYVGLSVSGALDNGLSISIAMSFSIELSMRLQSEIAVLKKKIKALEAASAKKIVQPSVLEAKK